MEGGEGCGVLWDACPLRLVHLFCLQPMEVHEGYGFGSGEWVCLLGGRVAVL